MPRDLAIINTTVKGAILAGDYAIELPGLSLLSLHLAEHHDAGHVGPGDVGAVVNEYWKLALLGSLLVDDGLWFVGSNLRAGPSDLLRGSSLLLNSAGGAHRYDVQLWRHVGSGIGRLGRLCGVKGYFGLDECPLQAILFLVHII